ncbi:hypothetical protein PR202_ga13342 [Eleusine coracana subsp. coracana]|uniref:POX domain-containing protein n=1 Tax=Eleusine coracana subsp. coracana TaxID=191504 RepID=A0AAV5CDT7_ELECO|nr:hypothetical protein PR202_ga13342 [Eleusine coracana subsp. coracana]
MGIAAPPSQTTTTYVSHPSNNNKSSATAASNSMSDFHPGSSGVYGGFSSSDGFDRPDDHQQDHSQHVAQQSRREKLRVQQQQGFDPQLLPAIDGGDAAAEQPGAMYEHHHAAAAAAAAAGASNMLSEMFNFPAAQPPSGPSATELLASQMSAANYRFGLRPGPGDGGGWFGARVAGGGLVLGGGAGMVGPLGETSSPKQQQQGGMDPAAAMQLFLMNPQQQSRSSPTSPPPSDAQSAIQQHHHEAAAFQAFGGAATFGAGGAVEGPQGLSLSLSPSLQQLEMAKHAQAAEELRVRDGVLYFNRQQQQQQQTQLPTMALQGGGLGAQQALHVGYGPAGVAGVLRNSKYTRAAQELLEEFCSVGRGQINGGGGRGGRGASSSNPNNAGNKGGGGASSSGAAQSAESKEPPALSPADRFEHQRKKAKLISMLDEAHDDDACAADGMANPAGNGGGGA